MDPTQLIANSEDEKMLEEEEKDVLDPTQLVPSSDDEDEVEEDPSAMVVSD